MRRLLTGHAVVFNRRHRRSGHLFQNRYKSIVCEEDPYLLELVRYIHLNPLRAGLVKDLKELDRHRWSGHTVIMGVNKNDWQEVEEVLRFFLDKIGKARRAYRRFVEQGIAHGQRPDLQRGGLRELGGEESVEDVYDLRVLGKGDFVQKVLESVGGLEHPGIRKVSLEDLVSRISQTMRVEVSDLVSGSRRDNVSRARALIAYLAVRGMKYRGSEVGRILGLSEPGIMKCVDRGKRMLDDDYELSKLIS